MNTATLVHWLSPYVRALCGQTDLRITQVSLGESSVPVGWHGSAKVYVRVPTEVVPGSPAVPFFLDFRVNHPKRLARARPDEFHDLIHQLERTGYCVIALTVTLDDGTQLEVINDQLGRTV